MRGICGIVLHANSTNTAHVAFDDSFFFFFFYGKIWAFGRISFLLLDRPTCLISKKFPDCGQVGRRESQVAMVRVNRSQVNSEIFELLDACKHTRLDDAQTTYSRFGTTL